MSKYSATKNDDLDLGALGFADWSHAPARSAADPDMLARAVRAHKAADALAQVALTVVLMFAIGAVAFVLSAGRASAAALSGMPEVPAALGVIAVAGAALLLMARAGLRHARVRARRRADRR